jgi:hypothetical protein
MTPYGGLWFFPGVGFSIDHESDRPIVPHYFFA